jgi:hypothetical protein
MSAARQIGNAVPILLGEIVVAAVVRGLGRRNEKAIAAAP